jgi:hypothetical protein
VRVELFLVSGSTISGSGSAPADGCYLRTDTGAYLDRVLREARFEVVEHDYADSEADYLRLVRDLRSAGSRQPDPHLRLVLVGHSHGGVWTHAAVQSLPMVEIAALVDLDATSYGWAFRGTPEIGDPRNAFTVGGTKCDLEDVVFRNVRANLEVRSGEFALKSMSRELYDEQSNVSVGPEMVPITTWNVATSHNEVHRADGTTLPRVAAWLGATLR